MLGRLERDELSKLADVLLDNSDVVKRKFPE
jgi:hypothetical protein